MDDEGEEICDYCYEPTYFRFTWYYPEMQTVRLCEQHAKNCWVEPR